LAFKIERSLISQDPQRGVKTMDQQLQKIQYAALAERLALLADRGVILRDEFYDVWIAMDALSHETDEPVDLLDLEEAFHSTAPSVVLTQKQQRELRLAVRACRRRADDK